MKDVVYWVTVRTTQTIPQLFSAVGGHTEGVVSAVATAGIISVIIPGSFIALNQAGECITRPTGKAAFDYDCGVDVDLSGGSGSQNCTAEDGSQTAPIATLCGGSGIILSSNCHGDSSQAGCGTSGNNNNACANGGNYAGCTSGSTKVWSITTQIQGDANTKGWVDDSGCTTPGGSGTCTDWIPKPVNTDNQEMFKD